MTDQNDEFQAEKLWPIELAVQFRSEHLYNGAEILFDRWSTLNYLIGPNGSGKTTVFNEIMRSARKKHANRVKVLGTGRLGALERAIDRWWGANRLQSMLSDEELAPVYLRQFEDGYDTAHDAFLFLEKR